MSAGVGILIGLLLGGPLFLIVGIVTGAVIVERNAAPPREQPKGKR